MCVPLHTESALIIYPNIPLRFDKTADNVLEALHATERKCLVICSEHYFLPQLHSLHADLKRGITRTCVEISEKVHYKLKRGVFQIYSSEEDVTAADGTDNQGTHTHLMDFLLHRIVIVSFHRALFIPNT